jgi:DNA-binding winged helix-turn-helix (wHTH) protein
VTSLEGKAVCWRFGAVEVNASALRVCVDGVPRAIEPKAFRLLRFLIENRGRAVSKQEILDSVWAGAAVTDNALTRAVAHVRKAIRDDSRRPRYIETVPTFGYRFVAQVEVSGAPDSANRRSLAAAVRSVLSAIGGAFAV